LTSALPFRILPQPDDVACGPTCLHAVYRYFGDEIALESVIDQTRSLEAGGTLGVFLASHALRRGYRATVYAYNLQVFDPTWFEPGVSPAEKLREQRAVKDDEKLAEATDGYLEFLGLGGRLAFTDLNSALIRKHLKRRTPILTGLSATYLYRSVREVDDVEDDVRGEPVGHFVVLCGYDATDRTILVADPLESNPLAEDRLYRVKTDRLIAAILLGIVTYDANLVVLEPRAGRRP
jgi:hypothetical protein